MSCSRVRGGPAGAASERARTMCCSRAGGRAGESSTEARALLRAGRPKAPSGVEGDAPAAR
eukprot:2745666-Alexandrium_andersonii.AAC.1